MNPYADFPRGCLDGKRKRFEVADTFVCSLIKTSQKEELSDQVLTNAAETTEGFDKAGYMFAILPIVNAYQKLLILDFPGGSIHDIRTPDQK